ncbi:DUF637 domain-containing protein [Halomonas sp. Mc5H-6]|uniref:two-partner secretion domain-containing protein n=1 Tax=Halomonas sp. Mc5H-6 TaxID=2954500 RepID=UPI002098161F|nr:DUF637 domain-containing protein [Halomonas sp. Mc5H-6]MCO7246025.1 DUF637 domain-containing protein [Halomonas sp. Mc5H-6]
MNSRSPLSRYVTILIINALFWHPAVVLADGIAVAPGAGNTTLDRAGNGVPVVDIATPNGSGLSHNRFSDYNVDERGVILNNATSKLQSTQLGGLIVGNPNLRDQAARRIINEVNGGRPSRLEGYTEVAGAGADVVVANPYGITCNGCGFINSPRVTLSTGRPIIEDGDLERFAVDQGRVAIEGLGLDATQVDQFDIITRAAEVNAELHANRLNVITGANDVDAETLATTARQGTGEAPALAIDASALGGMYAGSIRLIGTESGVGVKLAGDMAASEGDILIDANGHLRLADASSTGQTQVNATRATLGGDVHASQAITVRTRDNLDIDGNLTSGDDITLDAGTNIDNQGTVVAGIENDTLQPDADLTLRADRLDNHGWLDATERLMVTSTEAHNHGRLLADEIAVEAASLDNGADGQITAGGDLTLDVTNTLDNTQGWLQANGNVSLTVGEFDNRDGTLLAEQALDASVVGTLDNRGGSLSGERLAIDTATFVNDGGQAVAGAEGLSLSAQQLDNRNGLVLTQNGALDTYFGLLQNQGGALQGDSATFTGDTLVNADDGLIAGLDGQVKMVLTNGLDNRDGQVLANGTLDIDPPFIDNRQGQLAGRIVRLEAGHLDNASGIIEASENLAVDAERLTNTDGELRALGGDDSRLTIADTFDNQDGRVELASDNATLEAGTLRNGQGQLQHAGSGLFQISADRLANAGGQVQGTGSGKVTLGQLDDIGQWQFNGALDFDLEQELTLVADDRIATAGHLNLNLGSLDNRGQLLANDGLTLTTSGDITNRGLISTQGDLAVSARHLTQRDGRLASGDTSTYHLGGNLDNQGFLTGVGDVDITTAYLNNRGTLGSQADLRLVSRGRIDNRPDTLLFAGGDMTLRGQRLFNRYGDIYSRGSLGFARDDQHTKANSLENRSGTIEAEQGLRFYTNDFLNTKDTFELAFHPIENRIEVNSQFIPGYDREFGTHQCDAPGSCYKRNEHKDSYNYTVTVHELGEYEIKEDSASGVIASNGDISIRAKNVINSNSSILGNGNVSIFSATFQNSGGGLSKVNRQRAYEFSMPVYVAEHRNEAKNGWNTYYLPNQAIATFSSSVAEWNQRDGWDNHGNLLPLPIPLNGNTQQSDITTSTAQGSGARAVVQAGKQVTINASNNIQNGAVRNNVRTQIDGNLGNSATDGPVSTLDITLNRRASDPDSASYRDVPFERVSPTQLSSFRLPQGRYGLFVRNTSPQSRYLIETNPEFTSTERLMGSDYLLDKLDYTDDGAYQLLGDGRYESRLVRDAVLANTGQRFLEDSLSDDYAQYRQLMDNAVAARDALQLSVGVGLTPAQTAALTHDIVWLEEQQVDGETVLAPVLYLAQVDERNVRGGSLIQGRDIDLITGGDLVNVATIRASDDLSATSGDSVLQGGLIEAGQRLALSARDSIRNALAGEIRGGQVSLAAREGDIVNDRTAVTAGHDRAYSTYLDQGGLINARDGLELSAGRDIVNRAEIASQGDVAFLAGRDIVSEAVADARRQVNGYAAGVGEGSERTTQLGASLTAGGDAALMAGRDVRLTASTVDADGALGVTAARDIRLEAGEDTTYDWDNNTSIRRWYSKRDGERTTTQVGSQLSSGDDTQLNAGRDVRMTASEIDSGASLSITAGSDIVLDAAEDQTYTQTHRGWRASHTHRVEQVGSELKASDDIALQAGRDVTAIASRAEAGGDLALDAGGDLTLAAAANIDHHESYTASTNWISRRVRQQGSEMVAGEDLTMRSGRDMRLIASQAEAGDDAFLIAGRDVELLAANDQDYSLYEKEESGLFSSSYQRDEINDIRAEGSQLESGGDLTVVSGADQRYQGARLEAGNDLTLASGGTIRFETASDVHTESHERSKSGFAWQSASGEGFTRETLRQSELVAQGELILQAADGLQIDVEEIDRRSVTRTIDAMVAANPDLAWLKEMEQRGDIDWRQVKAIHDSWDYEQSGLGGGAAMVIAIAAAATGQYYALAAMGGAGAGTMAVAASAAAGSLAGTGAVSLVNNRGNLGDTFSDTLSSDSLRSAAIAAVTAGVTQKLMGDTTHPTSGATTKLDLSKAGDIGRFAGQRATQAAIDAGVRTAIDGGSLGDNLEDSLEGALAHVASGVLFNAVGNVSDDRFANGSPEKIALHALTGGMVTEAMGGDFRTGAMAAGANEALVDHLAELVSDNPGLLVAASQVVGVIAAEMTKGDISQGAEIAAQGTRYNYLGHDQLAMARDELAACDGDNSCMADVVARYQAISEEQNQAALEACSTDLTACQEHSLAAANGEYARYGDDALWDLPSGALPYMQALFDENIGVQNQFGEATIARLLSEGGVSPEMAAVLAAMPVGYNSRSANTNRTRHEAYKDALRASMEKPGVLNPELAMLMNTLYRPNAELGSGSTAAAVRYEKSTGEPVGGRFHSTKASDGIIALQRWLDRNPTASPGDRAAAENVIKDMSNALGGE